MMWKLKNLMHGGSSGKDQPVLEGKTVDIGQMKVHVRHVIAEGGFSSVYLVKDVSNQKQYALKHIICNDGESLDLVRKEVAVMKTLKGHPNVVTLHGQTLYDLGRTKECFLVMEFCERSLVGVLEARGHAGFFDERQILLIFRDVCNAVYAMHCQSPPIAHRDLKAENVLMGADGLWKLCDFGSTSTNHKRFERPEEMGIEEDIIRKHTTPAYRAPEMWDLYNRELISEKVDIWALGCLLYRIAYLKSAFDGESKLQILNGNYRIPDSPRYSSSLVELIRDMLKASPEDRPDIMQTWYRVNDLLPTDRRKPGPDGSSVSVVFSEARVRPSDHPEHASASFRHTASHPSGLGPPPPILKDADRRSPQKFQTDVKPAQGSGNTEGGLGAFWATQYAQEASGADAGPILETEPGSERSSKHGSRTSQAHQRQAASSSLSKGYLPRSGSESSSKHSSHVSEAHQKQAATSPLSKGHLPRAGSESSSKHGSYISEAHQRQAATTSSSKEHLTRSANVIKKSTVSSPRMSAQNFSQSTTRQKMGEFTPQKHQTFGNSEEIHSRSGNYRDESNVLSATTLSPGSTILSSDKTFNTFVADFDNSRLNTSGKDSKQEEFDTFVADFDNPVFTASGKVNKHEELNTFVAEFDDKFTVLGKYSKQEELHRLEEELAQERREKEEILSKYEKLMAICRSQRQEIQELKESGAEASPEIAKTPSKEATPKSTISPYTPGRQIPSGSWHSLNEHEDKKDGSIWQLQEGMSPSGISLKTSDENVWQPFSESFVSERSKSSSDRFSSDEVSSQAHGSFESLEPSNGHNGWQAISAFGSNDSRPFTEESFKAEQPYRSLGEKNLWESRGGYPNIDSSNKLSEGRTSEAGVSSQPHGWAGF